MRFFGLALICMFLTTGCLNLASTNSTAQDSAVYSGLISGDGTAGGARFAAAQGVIQRNCVSCHSAFAMHSDSEWIQSGYVVAGNPNTSTLFGRIRGSGVSGSPQNMPPSGSVNSSDIQKVQDWILGIQATAVANDAASRTSTALAVLSTSCMTCHSSTKVATSTAYNGAVVPAFLTFTTDAEFYQAGLVFPGDPANSWIYRALRGHGDIGTMPQSGGTLSTSSSDALYNWISLLGNP
jgi:mono/diheme cytochrome c family protein